MSNKLTDEQIEAMYCDLLNEQEITICEIGFSPSNILEELDPIAYRCGLYDFTDSLEIDH